MNEIEVRRVRNALTRCVDAVPPLEPEELATVARHARSAPAARDRRRKPWLAAAAAAVVAAAAGAGAVVVGDRDGRSETTAGTTVVTFPEGSAVHLLTANAERRHPR